MLASFMLSTALEKSSRVLRAMGPRTYSGCTEFSGFSGFWELRVSGRRIRSLIAFLREEKAPEANPIYCWCLCVCGARGL